MGEVWLHYVGKGLYSVESFVKEAKKYGVSRAVPPALLGKLNWGDRIYLAQLVKREENGEVKKLARIFGFFRVEWINVSGSDEVRRAVFEDPRLSTEIVPVGKVKVERACGSYVVEAVAVTTASVETVSKVIREKAEELGEKVKVFVGGKLTLIEPIEVEAPFTRSLVRVELDEDEVEEIRTFRTGVEIGEKSIVSVKDYEQRRHLPREMRRKFENRSLFEFGVGVSS